VSITVRRLEPGDDRSTFSSGNIDLDRFFARYAGQNQFRHHIGTTYVSIDDMGKISGFVTVSASELSVASLSQSIRKRLPAYPVPVLRVARLAVDQRRQGQGIARELLRMVFSLAHRMAADVGCIGIVVDAKPEAVGYYQRLAFAPLEATVGELGDKPVTLPMFLELTAIPSAKSARDRPGYGRPVQPTLV
jgi:GNAT superfamily N-acetyltransferase